MQCTKHFGTNTSLFLSDLLAHLSSPVGLLAWERFIEHLSKINHENILNYEPKPSTCIFLFLNVHLKKLVGPALQFILIENRE